MTLDGVFSLSEIGTLRKCVDALLTAMGCVKKEARENTVRYMLSFIITEPVMSRQTVYRQPNYMFGIQDVYLDLYCVFRGLVLSEINSASRVSKIP